MPLPPESFVEGIPPHIRAYIEQLHDTLADLQTRIAELQSKQAKIRALEREMLLQRRGALPFSGCFLHPRHEHLAGQANRERTCGRGVHVGQIVKLFVGEPGPRIEDGDLIFAL
jgi:hypothetical protein